MVQESSAKVRVKAINQVCIVVEDLQKSMEDYWNILGIGPWDVYAYEAPMVHYYEYHGKPAYAKTKLGITRVGSVQLELVEHVAGDTIFRDFLAKHGEGLHHLNFLVDDVDETVAILAKEGFPSVQGGHFGDTGNYSDINIKLLHTVWEVVHKADNLGVVPKRYP